MGAGNTARPGAEPRGHLGVKSLQDATAEPTISSLLLSYTSGPVPQDTPKCPWLGRSDSALTLGLTISLFFLPSRTLWLPCLPPTRPLVESRRCRLGNMVCLPTSSPFQSQRPHYLWPPRKHPNAFQALLPPCLTRKQTSQKRSIPECGPKWKTSTMLQRRSFLIHYHSITKA